MQLLKYKLANKDNVTRIFIYWFRKPKLVKKNLLIVYCTQDSMKPFSMEKCKGKLDHLNEQ